MRLLPSSLLWRTFLLVAVLMLLSVLAWFFIFTSYERVPRARQLAQMIVSIVNLTRTSLVAARPDARSLLLRDLSYQEGIHVYPAEAEDKTSPLPDHPFLNTVNQLVRNQLGDTTRMTLERDGERALFVSFHIEEDEYWLALPRDRIEGKLPWQWLGWGAAALLLSLAGAWLIMFRVTRPLKALEHAAAEIGQGRHPAPVIVHNGPQEILTLARNFNQMMTDLARLDEDRALILAGISHDLRTPLTRLRMAIEMSAADETSQQEMIADIEEMDRSIGQFLDFARTDAGEPAERNDLAAMLDELHAQYRRRNADVTFSNQATPIELSMRPKALRRAVANLVDNALRHAGKVHSIDITLATVGKEIQIDVADRGPGIPADQIERLKLPFTRLETARSNAIGTGLGLAIVDRIVRSHGGQLNLLPRPGGGLIARISLPAHSTL